MRSWRVDNCLGNQRMTRNPNRQWRPDEQRSPKILSQITLDADGKAASLQQTRLHLLRLPDPRKTDLRYSELRLTLWLTLRLTPGTDSRVLLYGSMPRLIFWLTPHLIKKTAFRFVIDAASHQKDLVESKFLWNDDRVSLYDWRCVSVKGLSKI